MYSHFPNMLKKNLTFTYESKRGGMTVCIVIYLKNIFVNT